MVFLGDAQVCRAALQAALARFDTEVVHMFDRAAYDLARYHRRRAAAVQQRS